MVKARSTAPAEPDIEILVDYKTARMLKAICSMGVMQYENQNERERYIELYTSGATTPEVVASLQPVYRALKEAGVA